MTHPVVAVYARTDNQEWRLAGHAELELPRLLSAHEDLRDVMSSLPHIGKGVAHLCWCEGGEPRSELVDIIRVGPIAAWRGSPEGVGLELEHASAAPSRHVPTPPGPGQEGFWCALFSWASFCGGG